MQGSVSVHMAVPADRVWELVGDITRIGEFSPETFEAQWLAGVSGPAAGARFRGHVRRNGRGPVYWTTCTVVVSEPGREFAFTVALPGGKTVNTWRYRIEPRPVLCLIIQSAEQPVVTAPRPRRADRRRWHEWLTQEIHAIDPAQPLASAQQVATMLIGISMAANQEIQLLGDPEAGARAQAAMFRALDSYRAIGRPLAP
jgi:hypothetical protein